MFKVPTGRAKRTRESTTTSEDGNDGHRDKRVRVETSTEKEKVALRKAIKELQKHSETNIEKRLKYPDDPQQWLESEVKIDISLKQLQNLATDSNLYRTFVDAEGIPIITSLLQHENSDVVLDIIDLLIEFTDVEADENEDDVSVIMNAIYDNELLPALVTILIGDSSDTLKINRQSKSLILQILENMHKWDAQRTLQQTILIENSKFCHWLIQEISVTENMDELHNYACELLSVFASTPAEDDSTGPSVQQVIGQHCDDLLVKIDYFRKEKPRTMDEEEVLQNIFDCMCSCLMNDKIQQLFNQLQGMELMLLIARESKSMRFSAIKVLSYALLNNPTNSIKFMELRGYTTLFAVMMKLSDEESKDKIKKKKMKSEDLEAISHAEEHIISLLVSLFVYTHDNDSNSPTQQIFAKKFSENSFAKTRRIMDLFVKYYTRVYVFDQRVDDGTWDKSLGGLQLTSEEREDLISKERLSEGLFVLQRICIIIAFISQTEEIRTLIAERLKDFQIPIAVIVELLRDYEETIGSLPESDEQSSQQQQEKDVLKQLITFMTK